MKVTRIWQSDPVQPLTDPFPRGRLFFALTKGDIAHPYGPGNWFDAPYFKKVWRTATSIPLPFFSWDFGFAKGYAGAKVFGIGNDDGSGISDISKVEFGSWLRHEDIYAGSQAMHFTIRNGLTPFVLAAPFVAAWAILNWLL